MNGQMYEFIKLKHGGLWPGVQAAALEGAWREQESAAWAEEFNKVRWGLVWETLIVKYAADVVFAGRCAHTAVRVPLNARQHIPFGLACRMCGAGRQASRYPTHPI
jgi:hypothetical protein